MAYPLGGGGGLMSDFATNEGEEIRRIKVDNEQASFAENRQFRYFDELDNIDDGDQIVYKLTATNALSFEERLIGIYQGGRKYRVYAFDNGETFTGTLVDSGSITPLNKNLNGYIDAHPTTGVTIQRAVGADIFDPGVSLPYTGQSVLTDGNNNRAASNYSPAGIKSGIAENTTIWIVLDHIGSNTNTYGEYELAWEEFIG